METREINAYLVRAEEDRPVVWLASSPEKARDGLSIPVDAWSTESFEKQGSPLMWAHQYGEPPIGKVTKLTRTDSGLIAETQFSKITQRARETEALVREGTLNCCSVGFAIEDLKDDVVTRASLTELSVVPIGADVNAVALARSLYPSTPETTVTPHDAESMTWEHAAAEMVRLHLPGLQRPDAERKAAYHRLCRVYASHGKTPPEYRPSDDVNAWSIDDVRDFLLEGETDAFPGLFVRAGAVLSARNKGDLERAVELIVGVVERAQPAAETPETPTEPERATPALDPRIVALHERMTKKAS